MAEATRYTNVIVSATSGDSITGPLKVIGIKVSQGTGTNIITIKDAGSNVVWTAQLAANTSQPMDTFAGHGWQLRAGQTYTVNQSGSAGTTYIYLG